MLKNEYKNPKVEALMETIAQHRFTEADFADLAVACADQAGVPLREQRLIEDLVKGAL